jgi:hypothetical protein
MSAALALKSARAVGIRVRIDGDGLELEAPAQPPQAVLDLLVLHKADILRLLRPANDGWSPEDWRVFFDERAGIAEFDGGLSRSEAEARAFACCVTEWLNRNHTPSEPGRCLECGGGERNADPLLPFGADTIGHAWVHRACWPARYRAREAEAIAALSSMGVRTALSSMGVRTRGSSDEHKEAVHFTRGEGNERDPANDAA